MTATPASSAVVTRTDADGIATLTLDDPSSPVNVMNEAYVESMRAAVDALETDRESLRGVIVTSGKRSFCAGGDLALLRRADPERAAEETARLDGIKTDLRRLETLGLPVVAVLNGSALGGGLELALACHYRIAVDEPRLRVGLPEVGLGLLPGAGGTVRLTRMLGIEAALKLILPAETMDAAAALDLGIIDEIAADVAAAAASAHEWIDANPAPVKPWDERGFEVPGGNGSDPRLANTLPGWIAAAHAEAGDLPAPRAAMAAVVEGSLVDAKTASQIETRYFVHVSHTAEARNLIDAFFDRQRVSDETEDARADVSAVVDESVLAEAIAAVRAGADPEVVDRAARCAGWSGGVLKRVDQRALQPSESEWVEAPIADLVDRMLFAPALAAARVQAAEALGDAEVNVASIDAGFPAATGGAARFRHTYPGGADGFAARATVLAASYGPRFAPLPSAT
ncbi:enoyl-CoA hydratase/isomerase family protein [Paramicrobacterium agarici]|uniref:enoyl-CoA hydratase/isomerase family protein n=1 Tax=Paramicrobacterium agarici TaxID=630514 RepID=UPI00114F6488|nr:enoyl-CoA hydratase/isomerase family protein [Microbacterium agarici]TQO22773.1 enoyl-CoA hydratase/carnithine racemase [Microbacterium agarici]